MREVPAVLIVDDDPTVGSRLEQVLLNLGPVDIHVASSAEAAVSLLGENKYAAMILDIVLRKGSGFDVLEHAHELGLETPVVVTTAHIPDYVRDLLATLPEVRMIHPKPINFDLLSAVLGSWMSMDGDRSC